MARTEHEKKSRLDNANSNDKDFPYFFSLTLPCFPRYVVVFLYTLGFERTFSSFVYYALALTIPSLPQ